MSKGYTLVEIIVVLVLMVLAATLVAPALVVRRDGASALQALIERGRALAIRRGEAVVLRLERSGAWRLDGAASPEAGALATGTLAPGAGAPLTLVFSPLGSCAPPPDAGSGALRLDPLTCAPPP